jgi:phospholipase A2-like protein
MATMLNVHLLPKHRLHRVLRVALLMVAVAFLLSWATSTAPSVSRTADQPATPANEAVDAHPWGTAGCFVPGAGIDALPGLFDFRHACIHHGGCYQGLDRAGDPAVIDRNRCDALFRTDLVASCAVVHGTSTGWRAKECESTAEAYYAVARSFGATYYTGSGRSA